MIEPKQGVLTLVPALRQNISQGAVLPTGWSIYLCQFSDRAKLLTFLSEIAHDFHFPSEAWQHSGEANALNGILQEAVPEYCCSLLPDHLRKQVINSLGYKPFVELNWIRE